MLIAFVLGPSFITWIINVRGILLKGLKIFYSFAKMSLLHYGKEYF
jgi:hypothetical protein